MVGYTEDKMWAAVAQGVDLVGGIVRWIPYLFDLWDPVIYADGSVIRVVSYVLGPLISSDGEHRVWRIVPVAGVIDVSGFYNFYELLATTERIRDILDEKYGRARLSLIDHSPKIYMDDLTFEVATDENIH